jgi:hypothetical protein
VSEAQGENMTRIAFAFFIAVVLSTAPVFAQDKKHSAAEIQKDVADHRAMADAHLTAAKCLEAGKGEKVCHEQLFKDCKGLGIGKLCGMKHKH